MKKIICMALVLFLLVLSTVGFVSCTDDDECMICGGSGYYQKKDCPGC